MSTQSTEQDKFNQKQDKSYIKTQWNEISY